jgi:hypothetical protein
MPHAKPVACIVAMILATVCGSLTKLAVALCVASGIVVIISLLTCRYEFKGSPTMSTSAINVLAQDQSTVDHKNMDNFPVDVPCRMITVSHS